MPERRFLALLEPDERRALEAAGHRRRYGAGQVLFTEGDKGHDVYLLVDGIVKVMMSSRSGQEVILDLETAGSLLGELSAIDGQARSASAEAVTAIEVLVVTIDAFRTFLETQPRAAVALLTLLAMRLRASSQRQLEFGSSDALTRLCRCILAMIDRFGGHSDDPSIELPIAQHDIAKLTGLSREAVVKGLRRLRELGWIETQGRSITVRDLAALEGRALS